MPFDVKPSDDNNHVTAMELCNEEHGMDSSSEVPSSDESDVETRMDVLTENRHDLGIHLMKTTKQNIKLEHENKCLEQQVNSWKRKAEEFTTRLNSTNADLNKEKHIKDELIRKLQERDKSLKDQSIANDRLDNLNKNEQNRTKELERKIAEIKADVDGELARLQKELDEVKKEKEKNETAWDEQADRLLDQVTRLNDDLDAKDRELQLKRVVNSELSATVESLKSDYEKLKADILRSENQKPTPEHSKSSPFISSPSSSSLSPTLSFGKSSSTVDKSSDNKASVKMDFKQYSASQRKIEELECKVNELEAKLKTSENEFVTVNGKYNGLKNNYEMMKKDLTEKKEALKKDLDAKRKEISTLKQERAKDAQKFQDDKNAAIRQACLGLNVINETEKTRLTEERDAALIELRATKESDRAKAALLETVKSEIAQLKNDNLELKVLTLGLTEQVLDFFDKVRKNASRVKEASNTLQESYDTLLPTVLNVATQGVEIMEQLKMDQQTPVVAAAGVRHVLSLECENSRDERIQTNQADENNDDAVDKALLKTLIKEAENFRRDKAYYQQETAKKQKETADMRLTVEQAEEKFLNEQLLHKAAVKRYEEAEERLENVYKSVLGKK